MDVFMDKFKGEIMSLFEGAFMGEFVGEFINSGSEGEFMNDLFADSQPSNAKNNVNSSFSEP